MRRPVRILYTIPNLVTSGSRYQLFELIRHLDRRLFDPVVAVLKPGGSLEEQIRALGLEVVALPFLVPPEPKASLLGRCWAASRHFRGKGFDLWHSYNWKEDWTEPIIARLSGAKAWLFTKKNMSWSGKRSVMRALLAKRIIVLNRAMIQRFYSRALFRSKLRLIPLGLDVERFRPSASPATDLRRRLRLERRHVLVGCVANFEPVKGHSLLLQAAAELPDVHVVMAGRIFDRAYFEELQGLVCRLGLQDRAHFLDFVEDVPGFNSQLDIFVLPSRPSGRGEAHAMALLEAMACGLPCIATEIDGFPDMITQGVDGVLVRPESLTALRAAIANLANAPADRQRLGEAARNRVLEKYNITREARDIEVAYKEVLELS